MGTKFELEYYKTMEEVREKIRDCEGVHTQQAIYSTFHDCLTQICFGCKKIRTNLKFYEKEAGSNIQKS